jgi:hypothetical protein
MKKVLAIGVGALALGGGAFGAAWIAGSDLPEDLELEVAVASRQGPTAVWGVVSDFERHGAWRDDVTSVERVGDIAGKPAWRETGLMGESRTYVTAAWSPPHSLRRDLVEDGYLMGSVSVELVPEGMGTRVTLVERSRTPNPIARLLRQQGGGVGATGPALLRALADHLGDRQNQVIVVESSDE